MSKKDEAKEYDNVIQQLCDEIMQTRLTDPLTAKASSVNAALHSTVRSLEENYASASPGSASPYVTSAEASLLYGLRKDIDHVVRVLNDVTRVLSAKCLAPVKAKSVLEEIIESITCDHECKSCKYYRPKSIDYCNTARRIADCIVDTGVVEVYEPETK